MYSSIEPILPSVSLLSPRPTRHRRKHIFLLQHRLTDTLSEDLRITLDLQGSEVEKPHGVETTQVRDMIEGGKGAGRFTGYFRSKIPWEKVGRMKSIIYSSGRVGGKSVDAELA
jgi:hypothetical protein